MKFCKNDTKEKIYYTYDQVEISGNQKFGAKRNQQSAKRV
jgi:hypothetical protein